MRGRVIILVGAIILLAIVVVVVLMQSGSGGETPEDGTPGADGTGGPVVDERPRDNGGTAAGVEGTLVEVLVAYQNITRGMVIPDDAVGGMWWPEDSLIPGSYYPADQKEDVVGRFARTDVPRGAPVLYSQIVDSPALLSDVGSDMAAYLNREPPGTVAIAVPLDLSGVGQVAYGIKDGDRVDVIISFLFVDVDLIFQTRMPNTYSLISRLASGELIIGAPRWGRLEPATISPEGVLVGPSEPAQRPRLLTQRTVTDALVVHVGYFDEEGKLFKTPTPIEVDEQPTPIPGEDTEAQQQQAQDLTPPPTATPYSPAIITLGVSPQDALVLTWAIDSHLPINLALRQAGDRTVTETQPVTLDYMIRTYNAEPPTALEFALEPPINSVRRFDLETLYYFVTDPLAP